MATGVRSVRIARHGTREADKKQIIKVLRSPAKMPNIPKERKGFQQGNKMIIFASFKISVWLLCKEWIRGAKTGDMKMN